MLRLVELALFLAPFAVFAVWRFLAFEGGPSVRIVISVACALAVLAGVLIWLSREDALPRGGSYEPAHFQDGRIVSGHATPR
jgi:Family of unknown function (DUF6111)